MTGEGIYAFRCKRADVLFRTLQEHLQRRAFMSDENPVTPGINGPHTGPRLSRGSIQPSNSVGVVSVGAMPHQGNVNHIYPTAEDGQVIDSSYLEPNARTQVPRFASSTRLGSMSGPISPDIPTSPGSPNSLNNILEVTPLPNTTSAGQNLHHGISNVYQEFPVPRESNNNINNKRISLDVPPQEMAPSAATAVYVLDEEARTYENTSPVSVKPKLALINTSAAAGVGPGEDSPMYMNVALGEVSVAPKSPQDDEATPTGAGSFLLRMDSINDPSRCYENMEPLLNRMRHSKPEIFSKVDLPVKSDHGSEPNTPTSTTTTVAAVTATAAAEETKVNYAVLDLDNPLATGPGTGSGDLDDENTYSTCDIGPNAAATVTTASSDGRKIGMLSFSNSFDSSFVISSSGMVGSKSLGGLINESPKKQSLGYATIDFNKTIALSNTMSNAVGSPTTETGRRTRHS